MEVFNLFSAVVINSKHFKEFYGTVSEYSGECKGTS